MDHKLFSSRFTTEESTRNSLISIFAFVRYWFCM